jgi:hypothetical protein
MSGRNGKSSKKDQKMTCWIYYAQILIMRYGDRARLRARPQCQSITSSIRLDQCAVAKS